MINFLKDQIKKLEEKNRELEKEVIRLKLKIFNPNYETT